ncbi:unnamed protein product [Prunus armeniaca]
MEAYGGCGGAAASSSPQKAIENHHQSPQNLQGDTNRPTHPVSRDKISQDLIIKIIFFFFHFLIQYLSFIYLSI